MLLLEVSPVSEEENRFVPELRCGAEDVTLAAFLRIDLLQGAGIAFAVLPRSDVPGDSVADR